MWDSPREIMAKMPGLYGTEKIPTKDKLIWAHFYITGTPCHWWAVEFNHQGGDTFWGFVSLGRLRDAQWAYFSLTKLRSIRIGDFMEVDWEVYWEVKPASQVWEICLAQGWRMPRHSISEMMTAG